MKSVTSLTKIFQFTVVVSDCLIERLTFGRLLIKNWNLVNRSVYPILRNFYGMELSEGAI